MVAEGETLSGIAAANGLSTESLASWNGLPVDHMVISGSTLTVPTVEETGGVAATASDGTVRRARGRLRGDAELDRRRQRRHRRRPRRGERPLGDRSAPRGHVAGDPRRHDDLRGSPASAPIPSPWGDLYLDPATASAWNQMREASLATYGIDLHPAGPLSAYRTAEQQGEMYELFLSGVGAPANAPGYSSHEVGLSVDLATEDMRWVVDQIGWQYGWASSRPRTSGGT